MPTNLPPHYFDAEQRYREAKTAPEKIAALEEMLAIMPKHKGTDHLKADLRRRIARLSQGDRKAATQRASMVVQKEGAAQILVIGLPNAGKSQLVASLTNASPVVAEYPFTTQTSVPGMMEFENIKIQLVDTPPLVNASNQLWISANMVRADALLIVIDLAEDPLSQMESINDELAGMRTAIGRQPATEEESSPKYVKKAIVAANKIDLAEAREHFEALKELMRNEIPVTGVSALRGTGLEELRLKIFEMLDIIRVYTKTPGQQPDLEDPIVLERGSTLEDAATEVHKDFGAKLKFARVWGSGKHDGVKVKRDHILQDGDIIELHV